MIPVWTGAVVTFKSKSSTRTISGIYLSDLYVLTLSYPLIRGGKQEVEVGENNARAIRFLSPRSDSNIELSPYVITSKPSDRYGSLVILKLETPYESFKSLPSFCLGNLVSRGDRVVLVSTPFGKTSPSVLQNSVTSGIVSANLSSSLYFTDARSLQGSEGGPVFIKSSSTYSLFGLILPSHPMSSLTPILAISKSLYSLFSTYITSLGHVVTTTTTTTSSRINRVINRVLKSILLVSLPSTSTWCTGVLISSQGHVLTCSHAMSKSQPRSILLLDHNTSTTYSDVRLVHRCEGSLDLALLHCPSLSNRSFLSCPTINDRRMMMNTENNDHPPVLVLGHSEFPPDFRSESILFSPLPPTVTLGTLSKSTSTLTQTSAMVLRGHSGGALVNACSGDLLGIVTSHAKLNEEIIIHRLNFSVSVKPVREMISYARTGHEIHLDEIRRLDASEKEMKMWRLETSSSIELLLSRL